MTFVAWLRREAALRRVWVTVRVYVWYAAAKRAAKRVKRATAKFFSL